MSSPLEQAKLMIKHKYDGEVRTVLNSIIADTVYVDMMITLLPKMKEEEGNSLFNRIKGLMGVKSGADETAFNKMMQDNYNRLESLIQRQERGFGGGRRKSKRNSRMRKQRRTRRSWF